MNTIAMRLTICVLAACLAPAALAQPGDWYVAPPPAGDDANDCLSAATPCATIQAAGLPMGVRVEIDWQAGDVPAQLGWYPVGQIADLAIGAHQAIDVGIEWTPPADLEGATVHLRATVNRTGGDVNEDNKQAISRFAVKKPV